MNSKTLVAIALAVVAVGCISVKTESEIKPIHITMDVNLKVDRELDKAFAEETRPQPKGNYKAVAEMLSRGAAGIDALAMLEPRDGATAADRVLIAEENSRRMKRFNDVAKASGSSLEAVQKRRANQLREKMAAGTWYRDDSGNWARK